ncbi:MAG: response regulator transcription factor [Pseudomonadota bacterium]|nr:response regulator transcription factor [Pseudomonadota bacterium]MEE2969104.1 response regulator transcription factor [Pseudomonadota bacterium]
MRVLVVEDEPELARQIGDVLIEADYVADVAHGGEEGYFLGDTEPYDAVLLDLGLPNIDGITVLERWRRAGRDMPVLILTARDQWREKVAGFDAGADDYVTKPFQLEEILARIRALIRRASGHASPIMNFGALAIDTSAARVTVDGAAVKLTGHEYKLISYMAHHAGKVISRAELTEHVYDQDFDLDSNTIEVFVGRIRRKLSIDVIETVRGLGYRLRTGDED